MHDLAVGAAPAHAGSAARFGAGSDFGFEKPSSFFDLPAPRSETRRRRVRYGVGFGERSVGPPENRLRFFGFPPQFH